MPRVKEIKTGKLDHMKRQNYFKPRQVQFCKVIEGLDTEYYLIKLFRHDDKLHRRVPKGSIQFNKADVCAVHMWEAKEEKKKLLRSQVILKNHVILFLPEPVVFLEKSSDESLEALELLEWYNCFVKEFKHRHHWEVEVPEKDYYKPGQYWLHLMEQSLCLVSRSNLYGPCDPVFACYDHYSLEDVEVSWSPGILDLNVYDKQQIKLKTPFAKDIYNVISEKTAELSAHKQSDVVKPVSPTTPFPPQRPDGAAVSVKVEPPDCPPTPPLRKDVESPLVNPDINASIVPPRPPRSPLHTRKDANLDKDMSLDSSEEDFKNLSTENVHRPLQMSASIPYSVEAIRPLLPPLRSNSDQSGLVSNFQTMPPPLPPRTPCKKSDQQKSKPSDLSSSYHDVKAGKKWQNVVVSTEEEQGKTNEMILNIPVQSFDQNVTIPCSPKTPSPTLTVNPKGSKKDDYKNVRRPLPAPRTKNNSTGGTSALDSTDQTFIKFEDLQSFNNGTVQSLNLESDQADQMLQFHDISAHQPLTDSDYDTVACVQSKALFPSGRSRSYSLERLSIHSDSSDLPVETIYGSAEDLYDIHKLEEFREKVLRGDFSTLYSGINRDQLGKGRGSGRKHWMRSALVQSECMYVNDDLQSKEPAPQLPPRDYPQARPGYATLPNLRRREDRNTILDMDYWASEISQTLQLILEKTNPVPDTLLISSLVKERICFKLSYIPASTDWHNFAEEIGLHADDIGIIENFARFHNVCPAKIVLNHWQVLENNGVIASDSTSIKHCTKQSLLDILEKLERLDLVELIKNRDRKQ